MLPVSISTYILKWKRQCRPVILTEFYLHRSTGQSWSWVIFHSDYLKMFHCKPQLISCHTYSLSAIWVKMEMANDSLGMIWCTAKTEGSVSANRNNNSLRRKCKCTFYLNVMKSEINSYWNDQKCSHWQTIVFSHSIPSYSTIFTYSKCILVSWATPPPPTCVCKC